MSAQSPSTPVFAPFRPRRFFRHGVYGLAAFGVAVACSDDVTPGPTGPSLRFSLGESLPLLLDVPFPSDIYLDQGHIKEPLPGIERLLPERSNFVSHELAQMDGFSRIAMTHFYVDELGTRSEQSSGPRGALIDVGTLPKGEVACASAASSVFLLDLEAPPESARLPCRAYVHADGEFSETPPNVAVGPAHGILLKEGHRYATVLTNRVKNKAGQPVQPSQDWLRIRKGDRANAYSNFYVEAAALVNARLAGIVSPEEIVGIAPFTTHTRTNELYSLREALEELPAPTLLWSAADLAPMGAPKFTSATPLPAGFAASLDDYFGVATAKLESGNDDPDINLPVRAHDQILSMGTAAFEGASFIDAPVDSGPNDYDRLEFAHFVRGVNGKFMVSRKEKIWVTLSVPKAPMPKDGYPVVLYQHGLGDSRHVCPQLANVYAAKGWVLACIDSITFGARSRSARFRVDKATDYEAAPGAKYKGPDGIADMDSVGKRQDAVDLFGSFYNMGAARDQLRQASIDIAELVRILAGGPDLTPLSPSGAPIKIDGTRIGYHGNSLGSVEGMLFAVTDPRVTNYVFSVAGGGLMTEIGAASPDLNKLLQGAVTINFGVRGAHMNNSNPIVSLLQTLIEPGDPLIFAPFLLAPRDVRGAKLPPRNFVNTEVLYDFTITNEASEALARAAGIGLALPNLGSNAEISDVKNIENNLWRVPLPNVAPEGDGAIRNTPFPGVTAVVVQVSPAIHGAEFVRSNWERNAKIPYSQWDTEEPFRLYPDNDRPRVRIPYRALQAMATHFFEDGFGGKLPSVSGIPVPVRDTDDDGALDAVDADPNDALVK